MGITARGAWVSVREHLASLGIDPDTDEFTAVGIGDMSGDVFGNGVQLAPRIRLIAAFDHATYGLPMGGRGPVGRLRVPRVRLRASLR